MLFFFFKQKTAYEIGVRLVGSEMCIRDRLGHHYPAAPTFGLPCPTTIFTFGVLLMAARPLPWLVLVAPMVWAAIGAAAAFSLGVTQDIGLLVMMVLGGYMLLSNQSPIEPPLKADGPRP